MCLELHTSRMLLVSDNNIAKYFESSPFVSMCTHFEIGLPADCILSLQSTGLRPLTHSQYGTALAPVPLSVDRILILSKNYARRDHYHTCASAI